MILKNVIKIAAFAIVFFTISAFTYNHQINEEKQNSNSENNGFVVLELFTSEGCSSCPSADKLIGEIENQYKDKPVFILSYHVDYWNNLGWKDRFSNAENSKRQQEYSRSLRSQIYTPQLIVNGKNEFVGSDREAIENAILTTLSNSENSKIDLSVKISEEKIDVNFKTFESNSQNRLLITLIQKKSETNVKRGENEGRHLIHWQIVHQQNQISLKNNLEGISTFKLPENFVANDWEIIGLIQNVKTGQILGSAKTNL